jgi:PAS domain S-box-containing protein
MNFPNNIEFAPPPTALAMVYAYDLSGKITFLNNEAERILGYSSEEACRMNIAEVVDPSIVGRMAEEIRLTVTEPVGRVYEVDVIAKDGRRVALEVSSQVVLRDGGRIEVQGIAVQSVIRNLSESQLPEPQAAQHFLI